MNADNNYWFKASEFIKQTCGTVRGTTSCRAKVVNYFRKTFKTVSDAEEEFSIDYEDICTTNISDDSGFIEVSTPATPYSVENFVDYYLSKFSKEQVTTIGKKLGKEVAINEKVQTLRSVLSEHELINIIHAASNNCCE